MLRIFLSVIAIFIFVNKAVASNEPVMCSNIITNLDLLKEKHSDLTVSAN